MPSSGHQNDAPEREQDHQADDADGSAAGQHVKQRIQQRPDHRRELAENIEEAEILVGTVRRDQLPEIGAGQRLNTALHCAHQYRHQPEKQRREGQCILIVGLFAAVGSKSGQRLTQLPDQRQRLFARDGTAEDVPGVLLVL